ncbi:MAG: hypothetical protein ACI4YB_04660 [Oscillospiraceae bacterium]
MLKKIIDAFYDFVDYGPFSSGRKEEKTSPSYILPNRNEEMAVSEQKNNFSDSYFDRHPYIGTSIIGFIVTVICCITPLRQLIGTIGVLMFMLGGSILSLYLVIINIAAFIAVSNEKIRAGAALSFFGGSLGCLLALSFVQPDSNSVKIISTACLWFLICVVISGLLFIAYDFRLFP